MNTNVIPSEVVADILGSLKGSNSTSLKAKIEKRLESTPQTSPTDTRNWDDRAFVASASVQGRTFMTYFTGELPLASTQEPAKIPKPKK